MSVLQLYFAAGICRKDEKNPRRGGDAIQAGTIIWQLAQEPLPAQRLAQRRFPPA